MTNDTGGRRKDMYVYVDRGQKCPEEDKGPMAGRKYVLGSGNRVQETTRDKSGVRRDNWK